MPPKKTVAGAKAGAKPTSLSKPTATRPTATQSTRKPVSKPSPTKGKNATTQKSSPRKSPTKATEKKVAGDKKPLRKDVPLTKEDKAAVKLQSHFRKLLAKKFIEKKKLEKEQYEEMIEKLQREAWLEIVKREREEAERERLKEEEERKRKREENKRMKVILEAAFDGDKQTILNVLDEAKKYDIQNLKSTGPALELQIIRHQMALVECKDANSNTPLSEAAAGGDGETIEFLISKGADVNTVGAFRRTPLYRAAFGGHLHALQVLLENGADPRKVAEDGNSPEQIASSPDLAELIATWDIQETERLLARNEKIKQERCQVEKEFFKKQTKLLSDEIAEAEKAFKIKQKQLRKAFEELNKRIYEHDKCALTSQSKAQLTLQAVHDAEADLAIAKQEEQIMREKLSGLKLRLREEMSGGKDQHDPVAEKGVKCNLKELDDVLMRDVGGKIKTDGRWPLIIDPSGQTTIFLRYRDTNYVNALNMTEMDAESLRKALIGAIRYGKFLVIDMMQVDMLEVIENRMDEILKGLFKNLVDKSILQNERYLSMVRDTDGPEYVKEKFAISRIEGFKLILITNMWNPPEQWLDTFYPIKVIISS